MMIVFDEHLHLELVYPKHSAELYNLAAANREYLGQWLPWLQYMESEVFIQNFINGSIHRNHEGYEYAFVILENGKIVGRIGIYKIDRFNRLAEIGYWIGEDHQGKGIITKACKALINYGFEDLYLNRIEIRCAANNIKSRKIPEKLGFVKEGVMRQGEQLQGVFADLNIYSILKNEWS